MAHSSCILCLQEKLLSADIGTISDPQPRGLERVYALIIGINAYSDFPSLTGAIADTQSVKDFLITQGACAQHRIKTLLDEQATKANIVQALKDICEEPHIQKEDPIIIFYAGHGSEARLRVDNKDFTNVHGMMQMLIPHDFSRSSTDPNCGHGILDLHIQCLLRDIVAKKSDNLTLIMDCCKSGGIDRDDDTLQFRGVDLGDYTIPNELIARDGIDMNQTPDQNHWSGLHILLAACDEAEKAGENYLGGYFTVALLKLLREDSIANMTYRHVRDRLGPSLHSKQHPLLRAPSSTYENRILFTTQHGADKKYYLLRALDKDIDAPSHNDPTSNQDNNVLKLQGGQANGISVGSEFDVYSDLMTTKLIGAATAEAVTPSISTCTSTIALSDDAVAFAVQLISGRDQDLLIYIPREESDILHKRFEVLGEAMRADDRTKRSFHLVSEKSQADLEVIINKDRFIDFHTTDSTCVQYQRTRLAYQGRITINDIVFTNNILVATLRTTADFYWYFKRIKPAVSNLASSVDLKCYKLKQKKVDGTPKFMFLPTGDDLTDKPNQQIFVNATEKADRRRILYGYKIENSSTTPMFAALLHFDVNECMIAPYYLPARGGLTPLQERPGFLTVGYGDGGGNPRVYRTPEGVDVDIGHLKLFLSTYYIDFSGIVQKGVRSPDEYVIDDNLDDLWDELTIPIIQTSTRLEVNVTDDL